MCSLLLIYCREYKKLNEAFIHDLTISTHIMDGLQDESEIDRNTSIMVQAEPVADFAERNYILIF